MCTHTHTLTHTHTHAHTCLLEGLLLNHPGRLMGMFTTPPEPGFRTSYSLVGNGAEYLYKQVSESLIPELGSALCILTYSNSSRKYLL